MNQDHNMINNSLTPPRTNPSRSVSAKPPRSLRQTSPISLRTIYEALDRSLKENPDPQTFNYSLGNSPKTSPKFVTTLESQEDRLSMPDSKENKNISNGFQNSPSSSILLPNPLPKKKSSKNLEMSTSTERVQESQTLSTTFGHKEEFSEEREEFRDYNRRLKGKTLKDRVELIGQEYGESIKHEVEIQLQEIKEEIINSRQSSQSKVLEIHLHQNSNTCESWEQRSSCNYAGDFLDSRRSSKLNTQRSYNNQNEGCGMYDLPRQKSNREEAKEVIRINLDDEDALFSNREMHISLEQNKLSNSGRKTLTEQEGARIKDWNIVENNKLLENNDNELGALRRSSPKIGKSPLRYGEDICMSDRSNNREEVRDSSNRKSWVLNEVHSSSPIRGRMSSCSEAVRAQGTNQEDFITPRVSHNPYDTRSDILSCRDKYITQQTDAHLHQARISVSRLSRGSSHPRNSGGESERTSLRTSRPTYRQKQELEEYEDFKHLGRDTYPRSPNQRNSGGNSERRSLRASRQTYRQKQELEEDEEFRDLGINGRDTHCRSLNPRNSGGESERTSLRTSRPTDRQKQELEEYEEFKHLGRDTYPKSPNQRNSYGNSERISLRASRQAFKQKEDIEEEERFKSLERKSKETQPLSSYRVRKASQGSLPSFLLENEHFESTRYQEHSRKSVERLSSRDHQRQEKVLPRVPIPSTFSTLLRQNSTQGTENQEGGFYSTRARQEEIERHLDAVEPFQAEYEKRRKYRYDYETEKSPEAKLKLEVPELKPLLLKRDQEKVRTSRESGVGDRWSGNENKEVEGRERREKGDKENRGVSEGGKIDRQHLMKVESKCVKLMEKRRYKEALQTLLDTNREAQINSTDSHSIYINYLIAECYYKVGNTTLAETYAKRTIRVIKSSKKFKDKYVLLYYYGLLTLMANLCISNTDYNKAHKFYEKVLRLVVTPQENEQEVEIQRKKLLEDLHIIKYNIANVLIHMKEYEKGINACKEVMLLLLESKNSPERQKRIVSCLKKQAEGYSGLNRLDEAIRCYKKILDIVTNDSHSKTYNAETLIHCYDQLGCCYMNKEKYMEALQFYHLALKTKRELYGKNNKETGKAFVTLGKVYLEMKEYEKAFARFKKGNEMLETLMGRDTIDCASLYVSMAQTKFKMQKYSEAMGFYEIALEIYTKLLGPMHLYTQRLYLNLVYLSLLMNDGLSAGEYEQKLEMLLKKTSSDNVFIISNELGNIFRKSNQYKKAIKYYSLSAKMYESLTDKAPHSEELSLVYCNIASSNLLLNEYEESVRYYKLALRVLKGLGSSYNNRMIQLNTNIGKIYTGLKLHREAQKYFERAMILCRETKDINSERERMISKLIEGLPINRKDWE